MRGEGREGKWAQGRAPSPKKGSCALCVQLAGHHVLQPAVVDQKLTFEAIFLVFLKCRYRLAELRSCR